MNLAMRAQKLTSPYSWSALPWGERYQRALEAHLQPSIGKMYGFHMIKVGNLSAEINTEACPISHQVNVSLNGSPQHVNADPLQLPFAAKSVDACLMAHVLPWCHDPHTLLREADRVLVDDGWMVLSGFNPVSLIGLTKCVTYKRKRPPYDSRLFTMMRLLDWLSLLNYEVIHQRRFLVLPCFEQGGGLLNTHLPALGCMQLIVSRKRTVPLTLSLKRIRQAKTQLRPAVGATRQSREHYSSGTDGL